MHKTIILTISLLILCLIGFAQTEKVDVGIYYHPNATAGLTELEEEQIKSSLSDFFISLQPGQARTTTIDREDFGLNYGFINQAQYSYAYKSSTHFKPGISFVKKIDDHTFEVKISFISATDTPVLKFIHSLLLKRNTDNKFTVYSPFEHNTKGWNRKTIGDIDYIYEDARAFDNESALSMYRFSNKIASLFSCDPIPVTYYKFRNPIDLFQSLGMDYVVNQFYASSGGFAFQEKRTILAANNSEYYAHELCHIYTHQNRPADLLNTYADEGFATYMGGSGELSLDEILNYTERTYLTADKDLLVEFKSFYERMPNDIDFGYGLSGLFVALIHQKHGFDAVRELLYCENTLEAYFAIVHKYLNIDEENFDIQVRAMLREYNKRNEK